MGMTDISRTDAIKRLQNKVGEYNALVRQAERRNRDKGGMASKQEAEYYVQAIDICEQIINANLSQPGLKSQWERNKKYCETMVRDIIEALGGTVEPVPVTREDKQPAPVTGGKPQTAKPAVKSAAKPAAQKTDSGFVTKNASRDVPAETIESWHQPCPAHGLDDVVGMDQVVERLVTLAGDIGFTETDATLNIAPEKGICLYGFHGNGKTFTIQAFVNYMMTRMEGMSFLSLKGSDIHSSLVGVAEKIIDAAFQEAIDCAPSILFFDEIDNICMRRDMGGQAHEDRLTTAFLESYNMLVAAKVPVIVLAATNHPWKVDVPVLNRFTTKIMVPLPSLEAREQFLAKWFSAIQRTDDLSFRDMADDTDNFDFRDLKNLSTDLSQSLKQQAKRDLELDGLPVQEQDAVVSAALRDGRVKLSRALYTAVRPRYHCTVTEEERAKLEQYIGEPG